MFKPVAGVQVPPGVSGVIVTIGSVEHNGGIGQIDGLQQVVACRAQAAAANDCTEPTLFADPELPVEPAAIMSPAVETSTS